MKNSSVSAKVLRVAKKLENYLGTPKQKTKLPSPLEMLIATILSQNTNDKNSYRAYRNLRTAFPRWEDIVAASLREVKSAIKVGGMANQKAPRIKETLIEIHARYGKYDLSALRRKSDDDVIKELTSLKGVGVKTASCVLLFSMRRNVFPVDTHVHRICNRLGLVSNTKTPEKTFEQMKSVVPRNRGYSFHTNLIQFGRMVCRSANPACKDCPLYHECVFEGKKNAAARKRSNSQVDYSFMLLDNV